jgi:hypothetical protein
MVLVFSDTSDGIIAVAPVLVVVVVVVGAVGAGAVSAGGGGGACDIVLPCPALPYTVPQRPVDGPVHCTQGSCSFVVVPCLLVCGVVWCGVEWCSVVWYGVVWCVLCGLA